MKFSKVLITFIFTCWVHACFCKLLTSTFEMMRLLDTERKIIESLTGYFERQEKNGITFDSSVIEFVKTADELNAEDTKKLRDDGTPLRAFHLLYRLVQKWGSFSGDLECQEEDEKECPILTGADVIDVIKRREGSQWPSDADLKQAARNIVNVWDVYELDLENVTKGWLTSVKEEPLSADEIFYIANAARDAGMTYEAIMWFKFLLEKSESLGQHKFKTSTMHRRLALTYREYGMVSKGIALLQNSLKKDPDDKGLSRDLEYLKETGAQDEVTQLVRFKSNDTSKPTLSRRQYEYLCRSTTNINYSQTSRRLRCFLLTLFNYYGTAKVELLSKYPRIEVVYDVISGNETEKIMSYGDKSFQEYTPTRPFTPDQSEPEHRLKSGPMCEWTDQYPLMVNITDRLERMTKFHMYPKGDFTSSECYYMTNEGPGHISPSTVDYFPEGYQPFPFAGNRIATVMIQLSDVKYGGSIVFPKLNITVPVSRGAAVIWWNLKRDGTPSIRSSHMNCPVVTGTNWALFKHILYSNQLFRRPCEAA